jgi:hypothetical protein
VFLQIILTITNNTSVGLEVGRLYSIASYCRQMENYDMYDKIETQVSWWCIFMDGSKLSNSFNLDNVFQKFGLNIFLLKVIYKC